jgi:hypothetical protein
MYYVPCCLCHRTIFQIHEEGCDHPVCRSQGIPSRSESERKKAMIETRETGSDQFAGLKHVSADIKQPSE